MSFQVETTWNIWIKWNFTKDSFQLDFPKLAYLHSLFFKSRETSFKIVQKSFSFFKPCRFLLLFVSYCFCARLCGQPIFIFLALLYFSSLLPTELLGNLFRVKILKEFIVHSHFFKFTIYRLYFRFYFLNKMLLHFPIDFLRWIIAFII